MEEGSASREYGREPDGEGENKAEEEEEEEAESSSTPSHQTGVM